MPFRVADVERRRTAQLQAARYADGERRKQRGPCDGSFAGENSSAATPPSTAASNTTPGAPKRLSNGSRRRQPAAAPIRSAP